MVNAVELKKKIDDEVDAGLQMKINAEGNEVGRLTMRLIPVCRENQ